MAEVSNSSLEVNKKLIGLLDELLSACNWEATLFLKTASKRFKTLRDEAQRLLIETTGTGLSTQSTLKELEKAGHIKAYVSIYQADGINLQKWYNTLKALATYSIGRPVYRDEAQIKAAIHAKTDAQREAYVSVFIKEEEIVNLPSSHAAIDKLGHALMTLKMGAVKTENIIEFVHCQKRYHFSDDGLIYKSDVK